MYFRPQSSYYFYTWSCRDVKSPEKALQIHPRHPRIGAAAAATGRRKSEQWWARALAYSTILLRGVGLAGEVFGNLAEHWGVPGKIREY